MIELSLGQSILEIIVARQLETELGAEIGSSENMKYEPGQHELRSGEMRNIS